MGYMKTKRKNFTEQEIDNIVVAEADDNSRWTKPQLVKPKKSMPVFLNPRLAEKLKRSQTSHKKLSTVVNEIVGHYLAERR